MLNNEPLHRQATVECTESTAAYATDLIFCQGCEYSTSQCVTCDDANVSQMSIAEKRSYVGGPKLA